MLRTDFLDTIHEQQRFEERFGQNFFALWCKINDGITPVFLPRDQWIQYASAPIKDQKLYLPTDLKIQELAPIIQALEQTSPTHGTHSSQKLKKFGILLQQASQYLNEYLKNLTTNSTERALALKIAQEFECIGKSYAPEITSTLTDTEKLTLDEWFLGKPVFSHQLAKLGKSPSPEIVEAKRKKLFFVYFQALSAPGYKEVSRRIWQENTGCIRHLQDRTKDGLKRALSTPYRELGTLIMRRGVEQLIQQIVAPKSTDNIPKKKWKVSLSVYLSQIGIHSVEKYQKIYLRLEIPKLKQELAHLRSQNEPKALSAREYEITKQILETMNTFQYEEYTLKNPEVEFPAHMHQTHALNCIGASLLAGGFLDALGIKYAHANLPMHSLTFLVTSDKKVYWFDFTPGVESTRNTTELLGSMLQNPQSMEDFQTLPETGFTIEFRTLTFQGKKFSLSITPPEVGLQSQVLHNLSIMLLSNHQPQEAFLAAQQASHINPNFSFPYYIKGLSNAILENDEQAIKDYIKASKTEPESHQWYLGMGNSLINLHRYEEALEALNQALALSPDDGQILKAIQTASQALGKDDEAQEASETT